MQVGWEKNLKIVFANRNHKIFKKFVSYIIYLDPWIESLKIGQVR